MWYKQFRSICNLLYSQGWMDDNDGVISPLKNDRVMKEEKRNSERSVVVLRTLYICRTRKLVFSVLNQLFIYLFVERHRKCLRVDRSYRLRYTNMPLDTMVFTNGWIILHKYKYRQQALSKSVLLRPVPFLYNFPFFFLFPFDWDKIQQTDACDTIVGEKGKFFVLL